MKVHITATPEFSLEKLDEITALLQEVPGELKFEKGHVLNARQYAIINPRFKNIDNILDLTFEEYFYLIESYREWQKISQNDFVIIISTIRNSLNWFSAFNGKNIFVHGDDWEYYSETDSKFCIAHQCVENIFQSLINLNIDNTEEEPNIHFESIGCINDFCEEKKDILKKIRTADICESCYDRAISNGVSETILAHIINIIEVLRKEFVALSRIKKRLQPEIIEIDKNGNVKIGDKLLSIETLPKVILIFFVKNLQGVNTKCICECVDDMFEIYKSLRPSAEKSRIEKMCCLVKERDETTIELNRAKLKRALKEQLGSPLYQYYFIDVKIDSEGNHLYKVNLTPDFTILDSKFNT